MFVYKLLLRGLQKLGHYQKMKNPEILLSFDIEEFDLPEEYGASIPEEDKFEISRRGTQAIIDLMKETGAKAAFFTTAVFAMRYPELIRQMVSNGHEIASHGMNHSTFEAAHLDESRKILQDLSGQEVAGFRMARLAKVDKEEIKAAGYTYESSLNPIYLPGHYCNLRSPLLPFKEDCGLWQFPVSAVPGIRFPLFWLAFKNMPLFSYSLLAGITLKMTGYYNMYSHPWEYNFQAKEKRWQIPGFVVRHAGEKQIHRLRKLIAHLGKKGRFITFQEYLKNNGADE